MNKEKINIMFFSLILTLVIFMYQQDSDLSKVSSASDSLFSNKGVYVINNIEVEYLYDKENYEVIPFVTDIYAVIKGDKGLLNVQKWSGKPKFYIDLRGKPTGVYSERVQYDGINDKLDVEIYPKVIDLRLMEQQTVRFKPVIELKGVDKLDKNLIVSMPILLQDEVKVRGTQEKLSMIGNIKGVIDVSDLKSTSVLDVKLKVYDREGLELQGISLLDKEIKVQVPIEKKVTVIKEEVIKQIVVEQEIKEIEKKGVLSFINIPNGLKLKNLSSGLTLTKDFKIDLKGFKEGVYEVTLNDNNDLKVVKFELYSDNDKHNSDSNSDSNKGAIKDGENKPSEDTDNVKEVDKTEGVETNE